MSDIDEMKMRRLDLTSLLVFLALMRLRKATAVAEAMGLTQSSISHTLGRLRDAFGDELFLRRPHGLEPTAIATGLEPRVRAAVDLLREALSDPSPFDAATSTRTLRIGAFDAEQALLAPGLIGGVRRQAPGMRVVMRPQGRDEGLAALASGELDLLVGYFWRLDEEFSCEPLYADSYLTVARDGHPWFDGPATPERFCRFGHVVVSPRGDLSGVVDRSLQGLGLSRDVVAALPHFLPALAALAGSDLVATLPARLVQRFAPGFGLRFSEPPVSLRALPITMVRHRRDLRSGPVGWLCGMLREVSESAP